MKAKESLLLALCLASSAMSAQAQMNPGAATPDTRTGQYQQPGTETQAPTSNSAPSQTQTEAATAGSGNTQAQPASPAASGTPQEPASSATSGTLQEPASSATSSAQQPASSGSSDAFAALTQLEPKSENGVTYLCGGVGLDESQSMKREARNYDLMLTFAARDGSYLADASVDIADARGNTVLKTTCGAPILLVDLPKGGTYRIRSEVSGHAQTKTVNVQNKKGYAKSMVMVWPRSLVEQEQSVGSSGSPR